MVSGLQWVSRYRSWLIVGAAVLLVFCVRLRLRDMPLERDEGEYAYAGQLMLQGVPPYKEAYNMKLPGTYAAYAVIMAVFGQTPAGIHIGVALVNAASIVLMFLLGRKILDEIAGVAAAVFYALLSTSYSILGLQGHATHFVVLPALGGFLLLLKAVQTPGSGSVISYQSSATSGNPESGGVSSVRNVARGRRRLLFVGSGLLMGIAFLMKQHGVFFGVFGGLFILYCRINERTLLNEARSAGAAKPRSSSGSLSPLHAVVPNLVRTSSTSSPNKSGIRRGSPTRSQGRERSGESRASSRRLLHYFGPAVTELGLYAIAFITPWLLTCFILAAAGLFKQFIFWTITYAATYVTEQPANISNDALAILVSAAVGANLLLWLTPWVGAIMMWWDERLTRDRRFLLTSFLICSLGTVGVGLYLREHYFITLLPAMGLLTGVMVSRGFRLLKHDRTIELFLALPILALFVIGTLTCIAGNGEVWFGLSPEKAMDEIYHTHLFSTSAKVGDYVRTHSNPNAKIAVLGSEPEIYFAAHRRGATGYIYTYPLMEKHRNALTMQRHMIQQIQSAEPEYVTYVKDDLSWLRRPDSEPVLDDWWNGYWGRHYEFVNSFSVQDVKSEDVGPMLSASPAPVTQREQSSAILLFQKKR